MMYLTLFFLSFVLTYAIRKIAIKNALVAKVNERSSHTTPIPHGGGIAIAITWFCGLIYLRYQGEIDNNLFAALMVGILISTVSYLDDLYELSPKIRLTTQAIVAIGGLYFLGGFQALDLFLFTIDNPIATNLFAFFLIIWYINLYNFLDGINGYAGSETVFLAISGYFLFGGAHFLILAASVLGFLYWNWNKAKIFMGDVGSTLLGYNIAIFTLYYANKEPSNFWVWIILFSLFWFDATLTLYRRFRNKERLSKAHKKHAYQRLTQAGWKHVHVSSVAILVNIILFGIVFFIKDTFWALISSIMLMFICIYYVDKKKAFE